MAFRKLYPPITPYSSGFLDVDDGLHTLYWEQSGNPDGVPIIVLHGGPGAGAGAEHRQFFDPDFFRIIVFDQRGCGRSEPSACIDNNTPNHLVQDIDALRKRLKIERMHLFGGSWGSTLALLYATQYPQHCISLVLRSIFLMTKREVEWFLYGIKRIFPEAWERFSGYIPENERADLLSAYLERLEGHINDEKVMEAALEWIAYESSCSMLYPHIHTITSDQQKEDAVILARLEAHYFKHHAFDDEAVILKNIDRIRSIPATIIQGRYDILAPIETAHMLRKAWPEADYVVVPDGGHSALDPTIRDRLLEATDALKHMT